MSNPVAVLSNIDEIAYLSGIFNWSMSNGSYINPDGLEVAFHVLNNQVIPLEQYASGAINAYNLLTPTAADPNTKLFNTFLNAGEIREGIQRKYTLNRTPFANYDQPVDIGTGSQRINFKVVFCGTQYQAALLNLVQALFNNNTPGLGTLNHPFYNQINNVLPIELNISYTASQLNCMVCDLVFLTSDLSHLNPAILGTSLTTLLQEAFIGTQNTITSLAGTISAASTITSQTLGQL